MIQFNTENKFRDWLLREVQNRIKAESLNFQVLESKNVTDILICKQSESFPILAFVEVKLYKSSSGRINIGGKWSGWEGGFQAEILSKRPIYFDRYLRWVICNEHGKCLFTKNEVVSKYLVGGKITQGQQNNINPKILDKERTIDVSKITDEIISWLKAI